MQQHIELARREALDLIHHYGYHAVVPALLVDPAGAPWLWICLMALAGGANKSLLLFLAYGCLALTVFDHILYWIGYYGGRPLTRWLGHRWPSLAGSIEQAELAVRKRDIWAVALGRYLPLVGRWIGVGAGLANLPYARFAICDAVGVALTVVGFGVVSYYAGFAILDSPMFPVILAACFVIGTVMTILFVAWQGLKRYRMSRDTASPGSTS